MAIMANPLVHCPSMSISLAAKAPTTFEIKSAHLSLVALCLKSSDIPAIEADLRQHYGDMPGFFDNDPVVIDLSALPPDSTGLSAPIEFQALHTLLREFKLRAVAVRGGSSVQQQAALGAGLFPAEDAAPIRTTPAQSAPAQATSAAPTTAPVAVPVVPPLAMVVDKPLRSGQQVYARGRDLVVLAMVNPGAEVIADGHIHVYAPLRGKAIAGARGQTDARIIALSMDPQLISIAGVYRTSETPLPDTVLGKPAQIRLQTGEQGDRLIIDPLTL
jgi:septum site-determining protein MinC